MTCVLMSPWLLFLWFRVCGRRMVVTGVLMSPRWLLLWFRWLWGENGGDLCVDVTVVAEAVVQVFVGGEWCDVTVVAMVVVQGLWEENGGDLCVNVTVVTMAVVQLFVGGEWWWPVC